MLDKILKQLIFRILNIICCDFQNITCYSESKCRISCKCKDNILNISCFGIFSNIYYYNNNLIVIILQRTKFKFT